MTAHLSETIVVRSDREDVLGTGELPSLTRQLCHNPATPSFPRCDKRNRDQFRFVDWIRNLFQVDMSVQAEFKPSAQNKCFSARRRTRNGDPCTTHRIRQIHDPVHVNGQAPVFFGGESADRCQQEQECETRHAKPRTLRTASPKVGCWGRHDVRSCVSKKCHCGKSGTCLGDPSSFDRSSSLASKPWKQRSIGTLRDSDETQWFLFRRPSVR